jgi:hypothetical protein
MCFHLKNILLEENKKMASMSLIRNREWKTCRYAWVMSSSTLNQYLDITKMEEQTALNNERLEEYRRQLRQYEPEIQEWLVNIYADYDKKINRSIINFLKKDELFLLYNKDHEFRGVSYECYAHLGKRYPFLKNHTEMLFLFIKDYHRIQSQPIKEFNTIFISEEINEWIEETWTKYQVNVLAFAFDWVHRFHENKDMCFNKPPTIFNSFEETNVSILFFAFFFYRFVRIKHVFKFFQISA